MPNGGEHLQTSVEVLYAIRREGSDRWSLGKYETSKLWDMHLPEGWQLVVNVDAYRYFWGPIVEPIKNFSMDTVILNLEVEYWSYAGDETYITKLLEEVKSAHVETDKESTLSNTPIVVSVSRNDQGFTLTVARVVSVTPKELGAEVYLGFV